ncbi:hypothetical protein WDU94_015464 [Cyamophila willieti]
MKSTLILLTFLALWSGQLCENLKWYDSAILYEIYPNSFKDTDGDGIGDIQGVIEKLDYLKDLGINGFWMTPMYPSGGVDRGYDIVDFIDIDPLYGSMSGFERLIEEAHKRDLKVIMDFVPNHTSDQHEWFLKSVDNIAPYNDYFVWREGKGVNKTEPPNNWLCVFGGSAWHYNEKRKMFYLHQFYKEQPDLNFRSKHVHREIKDVIEFWIKKGADGFRIDALGHIYEDGNFPDARWKPGAKPTSQRYMDQYNDRSVDQPETFALTTEWRAIIDECAKKMKKEVLMYVEVYTSLENSFKYIRYKGKKGAHFPFNFNLRFSADKNTNATKMASAIHSWLDHVPPGGISNWVYDNHDLKRFVDQIAIESLDAYIMLSLLLPGVGITYYGDEIGMVNGVMRDDQSDDPFKRDFSRTPMQWDTSKHAGFTPAKEPWLPVNPNYWYLNVETQNRAEWSLLKVYREAARIKKTETLINGDVTTYILSDYVFALVRYLEGKDMYIVLINYNSNTEEVTLSGQINKISDTVYAAVPSVNSGFKVGQRFVTNPKSDSKASIVLRPKASVVLIQTADGKPYVPNHDHKHEDEDHEHHEHEHDDHHDHHHSSAPGNGLSLLGVLLMFAHVWHAC